MKFFRNFVALVLLSGVLTGCQSTGTISLDEAKNIASGISAPTFTPPPRTTADITNLLDTVQLNTAEFNKLKKWSNTTLKSTMDPDLHWKFYRARGNARQKIGRHVESLDDFRLSYENAGHVPIRKGRRDLMRSLALAEAEMGNFNRAIKMIKKAISDQRGRSVGSHEVAAQIYAIIGDDENTIKYARKTLSLAASSGSRDPMQVFRRPTVQYLLAEANGNWGLAEGFIRKSIEAYQGTKRKGSVANWVERRQFVLANNLIRQERYVEAEAVARESLKSLLKRGGKINPDVVKALLIFSNALMLEGRNEEAITLTKKAQEILNQLEMPERSPAWVQAQHTLGKAQAGVGDWQAAATTYDKLNSSLDKASYFYKKYYANDLSVAMAYAKAGRSSDAIAMLKVIERTAGSSEEGSSKSAEINAMYGIAYANDGDYTRALPYFKSAISELSKLDGKNDRRDLILQQVSLSYLEALFSSSPIPTITDKAIVADAFSAMQSAEESSVRKAISASAARSAVGDPELIKLVRQLQDSEHHLAAMEVGLANMLAVPSEEQIENGITDFTKRIIQLGKAITSIRAEIRTRFPRYDQLINPKPVDVATLQSNLNSDEALLSYSVGLENTYVFAIGKNTSVAAEIGLGEDEIASYVDTLRQAVDPVGVRSLGGLPDYDVTLAHDLYLKIMAPFSLYWKGASNLLVVANGSLGHLPFSMMLTEPATLPPANELLFANYRDLPWLARFHSVTVLPSVASLQALQSPTMTAAIERRPFVGFGDPYFTPLQAAEADAQDAANVQLASNSGDTRGMEIALRSKPQTRAVDSASLALLPRLPDTRPEILSIAKVIGADITRDVYLGRDASERNARTLDLSGYKVISFATHGLVSGDLDGLNEPALALSSPKVTGDDGDDGLLTMGEILSLKLNADWVVLSACNTAAGEGKGAEAVSGLGRAFFYAGSRALLVSNWPVHSAATTALMTTLFEKQANNNQLSRSQALRQTRVHLIDDGVFKTSSGKIAFSYAHPIFWAPFTIVGDGGV